MSQVSTIEPLALALLSWGRSTMCIDNILMHKICICLDILSWKMKLSMSSRCMYSCIWYCLKSIKFQNETLVQGILQINVIFFFFKFHNDMQVCSVLYINIGRFSFFFCENWSVLVLTWCYENLIGFLKYIYFWADENQPEYQDS